MCVYRERYYLVNTKKITGIIVRDIDHTHLFPPSNGKDYCAEVKNLTIKEFIWGVNTEKDGCHIAFYDADDAVNFKIESDKRI